MTADSLAKLLDENAELKPLAERLERIKRLQRRYRTLAPEPLARASRVCAIDGTTVVICATSGPVAAALKQLAPRLLAGLRDAAPDSVRRPRSTKQKTDQELNGIRIEVQVAAPAYRRPVVARGEMPREKLGKLAERLSDSPLRVTLERIARNPQSRRTRSKT